jgi:hypothetical protein
LFKIIDAMNPFASKLWIDAPEDIREFDVDLSKKNLECTSHRLPPRTVLERKCFGDKVGSHRSPQEFVKNKHAKESRSDPMEGFRAAFFIQPPSIHMTSRPRTRRMGPVSGHESERDEMATAHRAI